MIIGKETEDPIDWYARRYSELAAQNIRLYNALQWLYEDVETAEASGICLPNRASTLNALGVLITSDNRSEDAPS